MKGAISKLWAINLDDELKTLKRKVDCLTAVESDNLTILVNAEIQPGKKRRSEVELWFSHVKEKKSVFQQIETEFRDKGPSRNLKSRIEDETKEVEELIQQGKFPKGVVLDDHESTRIPMVTTTLVGQSCTENVDLILTLLKEDSVFAIGVCGMGGVGKTTLAKQIYNSLQKNSNIAEQAYWVTASRDCSLEKLQNEIGKVVGLKLSEEDREKKKALLFQRLSGMKKSVIILDDLWKHYFLEQVGIPLDSSGCKIVMTTRLRDVCCSMGCQKIIKIEPLCYNDAWKLFAKHLEAVPSHFNRLAEEIVKECGGLPLALVTMGCCARAYATVHDWKNALYELRRPVSRQEVMEEEVYRVLKFSFDSLRDQNVQNCFLCCVLFPEDRTIGKEYLVDLWIDAGLLDKVQSPQEKVSRGHAILNRLISSCLLESANYEYGVRLHDLVRDMATIITQNHLRFIVKSGEIQRKVPEEEQWSKDLVKVSLSYNYIKEIPNGMAPFTPQLTVLLLNDNPLSGIPESFFIHMRALTVLDLSHTDIERLPESVSDLENLRALLLEECSKLRYVPCLAKLSKLRVLDLDDNYNLEKAPEGIERLKCLEKVTYCPWDISDSTRFNMLIQSSPSLSCYRFLLCDPVRFKAFFNHIREENIVLVVGANIRDDKTNYLLLPRIKKLKIFECVVNKRNLGDGFPTLGLATELRELSIHNCEGLKYISSSSSTTSSLDSSIEILSLQVMPDLRGIIEFGGCTFSHLCHLQIDDCPKIKVIFSLSKKQLSLPNLKYIRVSNCKELEEIFESNNGNHLNPAFGLPNLVTFELYSLPKLQRLRLNPNQCASLEELYVWNCEELEQIFESSGSNNSSSSTLHVPVDACNPKQNPISDLSLLKKLYLGFLPKLGSIYKNLHLCTSLQELGVMDCPKIEKIFESSELILALRSLKELILLRLLNMSSIHRGLLICPSLYNVIIEGCLKLKRVPLCDHLICDDSPQTLLSLPSESDDPEFWELLRREHAEDARYLSDYMQTNVCLQ